MTRLCLLLFFSAFSATASAQCPANVVPPSKVEMLHAGRPGAWIHEDVLRCMYADLQELKVHREKTIPAYELKLDAAFQYSDALQQRLYLAEVSEKSLEESLAAAIKLRRDAEEERDAWYRSPWLWAGVGAVVVVALEVIVLSAVDGGI